MTPTYDELYEQVRKLVEDPKSDDGFVAFLEDDEGLADFENSFGPEEKVSTAFAYLAWGRLNRNQELDLVDLLTIAAAAPELCGQNGTIYDELIDDIEHGLTVRYIADLHKGGAQ